MVCPRGDTMTYRMLLALFAALALSVAGCNGDDDDDTADDDTQGDDDDDVADDDDVTDDDDDDTTPPVEPYLIGTVYDVTCTTPIPELRVTWCQDACIFKDTDGSGQFIFGDLEEGEGVVHVVGHVNAAGGQYSAVVGVYDIPASGFLEAVDVCLPEVTDTVELSSGMQTTDVGAGVELTLDPDAIEWATGEPVVGAVEVPDTAWQYVDIEGVTVLGVWAFYVWGSHVDEEDGDPIGLTLPATGDLGPGDPVTVYAVTEEDSGFVEVGTGMVDGLGTRVELAPGEGIHELTWVAYGTPE